MDQPASEPRLLFLRAIHQAKTTGRIDTAPNWFEFFVLDKTKDDLGIALIKALREVTDSAKKSSSGKRVTTFWQQLSGPLFMIDDHLNELSPEYTCVLLSLACSTVIKLKQRLKIHRLPSKDEVGERASSAARDSNLDVYIDVPDSPLEYSIVKFIDTIQRGSGVVTLGPPTWRDIAILSGTYVNLSNSKDSGVSKAAMNSLWNAETLLRKAFQAPPSQSLAPKGSAAHHLWKFYAARWKVLAEGGRGETEDYRVVSVVMTELGVGVRKRMARSTWQVVCAACGDVEDMYTWLKANDGNAGGSGEGLGVMGQSKRKEVLLPPKPSIEKLSTRLPRLRLDGTETGSDETNARSGSRMEKRLEAEPYTPRTRQMRTSPVPEPRQAADTGAVSTPIHPTASEVPDLRPGSDLGRQLESQRSAHSTAFTVSAFPKPPQRPPERPLPTVPLTLTRTASSGVGVGCCCNPLATVARRKQEDALTMEKDDKESDETYRPRRGVVTFCDHIAELTSKAKAAGGRLLPGPFKTKSVCELV